MKQTIYTLLLRSLDEELSLEEERQLQEAFSQYPELKQEKEDLLVMRQTLQKQEFRFEPYFSAKVLRNLSSEQQEKVEGWFTQVGFAFQRVGFPAFALLILLLMMTWFTEQSLSIDAITGTSDLTADDIMTGVLASF